MKISILRIEKSDECVRGILFFGSRPMFMTLEPPDKQNQPFISCIPVGKYPLKYRQVSPSLTGGIGVSFEVAGVNGRSDILLHIGNVTSDTQGCILLGRRFGRLGEQRAVLESRAAFGKFINLMDSHTVGSSIEICECVLP